jgi:hypothetical protein
MNQSSSPWSTSFWSRPAGHVLQARRRRESPNCISSRRHSRRKLSKPDVCAWKQCSRVHGWWDFVLVAPKSDPGQRGSVYINLVFVWPLRLANDQRPSRSLRRLHSPLQLPATEVNPDVAVARAAFSDFVRAEIPDHPVFLQFSGELLEFSGRLFLYH